MTIRPPNEQPLDGQAHPQNPERHGRARPARPKLVDVGGENSNQEQDEAPCGIGARGWEEEQNPQHNLGRAADPIEQLRKGQEGGNNPQIVLGIEKVIAPRDDIEEGHEVEGESFHRFLR